MKAALSPDATLPFKILDFTSTCDYTSNSNPGQKDYIFFHFDSFYNYCFY